MVLRVLIAYKVQGCARSRSARTRREPGSTRRSYQTPFAPMKSYG